MNTIIGEFEQIFEMIHNVDMKSAFGVDMSKAEFVIMKIIDCLSESGKKNVAVSDIVNKVKVSAQAISRCLGGLEKKGYIERFSSKEDRRRMEVMVTQKGRESYCCLAKKTEKIMHSIISDFGKNEMDNYIRLTHKLMHLYAKAVSEIQ